MQLFNVDPTIFAPQNIKNCPQKLLIIPIDQQFSVQQVFALCNWDSFIVWNFLIFDEWKNSLEFLWWYSTIAFHYTYSTELCTYTQYSLMRKKYDSSKLKNFINEKFKKYFIFLSAFYLIMWLIISPKKFEKIAILKIWQLVSFWGVKHFDHFWWP